MNRINCREKFNNAVGRLFEIAKTAERNDIADAADAVLLARDALSGLNEFEWDDVIADVATVSGVLEGRNIILNTIPQTTLTGQKTYKVLNKPTRFDA